MLPGTYPPNQGVIALQGNVTLVGTNAIWPGGVSFGSGANATVRNLVMDGSNGQYAGGYFCELTSGTATVTLESVTARNLSNTPQFEIQGLCTVTVDQSDIEGPAMFLGNTSIDVTRSKLGSWQLIVQSSSQGLHVSVVNSIFNGTVSGSIGSGSSTSNATSVYFAYNTFYSDIQGTNAVSCPTIGGTPPPGAITFIDNIIYAPNTQTAFLANSTCTADTNLVYPHSGSDDSGVNVVIADPKLVNAPNGDYHLMSNSPAIDAAKPTGMDPNVDYDGTTRPQGSGYDIGAFEYKP